jgi:hemolysin III
MSETLRENSDWYNKRLEDGGPLYAETELVHFIVDPWNAISSLFIVIPAIYWIFRISGRFSQYKFLLYSIPLMILGGTGSMLFHAFRASPFFLVMDVLPTAILTLSLTIYFWIKVFSKWWYVFFVVLPTVALRFWIHSTNALPEFLAINLSYTLTGLLIGLPLLIILIKTRFSRINDVILAILLFIGAIVFRGMDSQTITFLPMGTHFLWHVFTGIGAYFILSYLYYFRTNELMAYKTKAPAGAF